MTSTGRIVSLNGERTAVIDGVTYRGRVIEVRSDGVFVDNVRQTPEGQHYKLVSIYHTGNLTGSISTSSGSVTVRNGDIKEGGAITTMNGMVRIEGNVHGNVKTMGGNVHCDSIFGRAQTLCGHVSPSIRKRRRHQRYHSHSEEE
jgi:hypothetical protein